MSSKNCLACGLATDREEIRPRFPNDRSKGPAKGLCRPCYQKTYKAKYYSDPEKRQQRMVKSAAYHQANKEWRNLKITQRNREVRREVVQRLGGMCACCQEARMPFLCIDHINGGGRAHLRSMKGSNISVVRDVKKQGCPRDKYRILCWNCNAALGFYGKCPHSESA